MSPLPVRLRRHRHARTTERKFHRQNCFGRLMLLSQQGSPRALESRPLSIGSATKPSDYIIATRCARSRASHRDDPPALGFLPRDVEEAHRFSWRPSANYLVLTCHESVEKDDIDQSLRYFVQVAGQMKYIIGSLFTDVWRCEVAVTAGASPAHLQVHLCPRLPLFPKN